MKEIFLLSCDREAKHYEGLELREGASCVVRLSNFNLQICDAKRRPLLNISLKDITNVGIVSDKELVEKDRSVIGRGLVGSALFGGAGLILGGLSGIPKKQVEQNIDYLVINYKSNNEDKVLSVYANEGVFDKLFMQTLNNNIERINKKFKCPKCGAEYSYGEVKCTSCGKQLVNTKLAIGLIIGIFVFLGILMAMTLSTIDNSNIDLITNVINVSEEKAENIDNILNEIGLKDIKEIVADNGLDGYEGVGSKGYRIKTDFSDNVILYLDINNDIICIRYIDEYYYRNGNILKKFN